jgi:hypothetical protein
LILIVDALFPIAILIARANRRKLLKTALTCIDESISPLHIDIIKALSEARALYE